MIPAMRESVRWRAATGVFVVSLDSTVNIAFPAIAATFALGPAETRWVIVCYVFVYALVSFVGGGLGDRVGHAPVFRTGLAVTAVGFVLAGSAPTFAWLLAGRVAQGLGAGLVYGTAPGIVTLAAAPGERGRALGFLNAAIGLAFAVGPLAAGGLVHWLGWRSIFHARVPLALVALALALGMSGVAQARSARPFPGARILARPAVVHACVLAFVANASIFAIWWLAPFYLVDRRGLATTLAGALFMLTPLGTTLGAWIGGRVADARGARAVMVVGLAVEAFGLAALSRAAATTSISALALELFSAGLGLGLFQVPNMAIVMAAFPGAQQGVAGGLAFLARTLGVVAGVTAFARLFTARRSVAGFDAAFALTYLVAAAAVLLAAVAASIVRTAAPGRTARDDR